ncbi:hypothetical protein DFS34DRAFT_591453 [Phlyctochytrium arcticum]|nr:hypothetical protein DFS34DRAFT_591453 [Phlyctochytrium arcticum]
MQDQQYKLFRDDGCGSVVVEVLFEMLKIQYESITVPWRDLTNPSCENLHITELANYNPLKQVPTLITKDGTVLTESVAIVLFLLEQHRDLAHQARLRPSVDEDPTAAALFLKSMIFTTVNIYTIGVMEDFPERWHPAGTPPDILKGFNHKVLQRVLTSWKTLEMGVVGPFFLGEHMSILDVYVSMISQWARKDERYKGFFEEHTPKLVQVFKRTEDHPIVKDVWVRNKYMPGRFP